MHTSRIRRDRAVDLRPTGSVAQGVITCLGTHNRHVHAAYAIVAESHATPKPEGTQSIVRDAFVSSWGTHTLMACM